jgi:hypothetical protein
MAGALRTISDDLATSGDRPAPLPAADRNRRAPSTLSHFQ